MILDKERAGSMRTFILMLVLAGASQATDIVPPISPVRMPVIEAQQTQPPAPTPDPAKPATLAKNQYFVIDSNQPLLVTQVALTAGAKVTIAIKKGTVTLPAAWCIGRKPDADDPKFVTIPGPYIYIVEADTSGLVLLDILPTTNKLATDKDGKTVAVPFTESDIIRRTISVNGQLPIPPPGPVDPSVSVNPFSNQFGLHVLMTFDGKETESQKGIIYGAKVREYLNAKCGVGIDGKTKTYRIWPTATDASGEAKVWTDAFTKTAGKRRLLIGNGPNGYDGELPANVDEMLKLLTKYGN